MNRYGYSQEQAPLNTPNDNYIQEVRAGGFGSQYN